MERIGIIDLGSNSVRLVIIDLEANNAHHQIENLKETVRLVADTDENGMLSEKSIKYAVETIRLFANFCRERRVDHIMAVATAAVRRAGNRKILTDRIKTETNIEFRVLSGEEEAHLGYVGLINTMPHESALMADLGGGSLKLVNFAKRIEGNVASQAFGAVTLTNAYQLENKPSKENLAKMKSFLMDSYATVPWIQGTEPIIGLGGTFRSLARIVRKRNHYLPDITDALTISIEDVAAVYHELADMSLEERLHVPGLEQARADIAVAGIGAIYYLLKASNRKQLVSSTSSIRDGILYEYLHRHTGDPIVLSVLTHHIDNLIHYYHLEESHLRRVSNLAVTLFDQLQSMHKLSSTARRMLLVASLLHEIGVVISVEGRDKHTLYMLMNTPLHGLSHRERVIVAYVAASHDDLSLTNLETYIKSGPLLESDIELIEKLAVILQITHSLDRCHTGVVTQVRSDIDDQECTVNVIAKAGADLEINDARRKSKTFERIYDHKIKIKHI